MAAFLTSDVLRAHAAPALSFVLSDHADEPAWPRAALFARWLVTTDGRLTCRWQTDIPARFGPAPS
jgi:hypothetical protein